VIDDAQPGQHRVANVVLADVVINDDRDGADPVVAFDEASSAWSSPRRAK
jgi:hypothetical protein